MASIDAYKEFISSAPESEQEFRTLEIYHSAFTETLRFVNKFIDKQFVLEDDAPRNAGQTVTFTSLFINITEPQENKEDDSRLKVELGNLGSEVQEQMSLISGSDYLESIQVIYRKYYSGDLTSPVTILKLSASAIQFSSYTSVSFTAEDSDLINKNSGERYTLARFPQLKDS
jgi:hypothetical protein